MCCANSLSNLWNGYQNPLTETDTAPREWFEIPELIDSEFAILENFEALFLSLNEEDQLQGEFETDGWRFRIVYPSDFPANPPSVFVYRSDHDDPLIAGMKSAGILSDDNCYLLDFGAYGQLPGGSVLFQVCRDSFLLSEFSQAVEIILHESNNGSHPVVTESGEAVLVPSIKSNGSSVDNPDSIESESDNSVFEII